MFTRLRGPVLSGGGALAALVLTACAPAAEIPAPGAQTAPVSGSEVSLPVLTLSGEAVLPEGTAVPPDARLILELHTEINRALIGEPMLQQERIAGNANPIPFTMDLPGVNFENGGYKLTARLQSGYAILLKAQAPAAFTSEAELTGLTLTLVDPATLVDRPMITPEGTLYVCGGERLILALEAGAAYVTYETGESARLRKLDTQPGAAEQFSNGQLLVERRTDDTGAETLSFGQGQAVPQDCTAAE
jgi:uncharacterized lipoprotein YbaY